MTGIYRNQDPYPITETGSSRRHCGLHKGTVEAIAAMAHNVNATDAAAKSLWRCSDAHAVRAGGSNNKLRMDELPVLIAEACLGGTIPKDEYGRGNNLGYPGIRPAPCGGRWGLVCGRGIPLGSSADEPTGRPSRVHQ